MALSLTFTPILQLQILENTLGEGGNQCCPSQMLAVGSALYYVMNEDLPVGAPNYALSVWKSLNKTTWSKVATYVPLVYPPVGTGNHIGYTCCAVGTKIYIVGATDNDSVFPPVSKLVIHIYDTTTDAFLADSSFSPTNLLQAGFTFNPNFLTLTALNSGALIVGYVDSSVGPPSQFNFTTYTPGTDTWGAVVTISTDSSLPMSQIHDTASDLTFLFYKKNTTLELRCVTITAALAHTDVTVITMPLRAPTAAQTVGMPAITTNTNEVVLPLRVFPAHGAPILQAARATIASTPVFTVDTVEDLSTLPVNSAVQAWDQLIGPGWMAMDIGGLLYIFYAIDNGDLDSAASQAFLYYRSSTGPGVWSAPLIAFTSAVPGELGVPYGAQLPGVDPIILLAVINPPLWGALASLTNFIGFPAGAPPAVFSPSAIQAGSTGARFKPCLNEGQPWIAMQMAEKLRQERAKKTAWPYRHLFPADPDLIVNQLLDIPAPAQDGLLHIILQYRVPSHFRLWLDAILFDGPVGFNPGDGFFTLDENAQIAASSQASKVQGLINLPVTLGSINSGTVWHFEMPYDFAPLTVLRCKVMNANIVPGAPNFFTAGLFGFLVPLGRGAE